MAINQSSPTDPSLSLCEPFCRLCGAGSLVLAAATIAGLGYALWAGLADEFVLVPILLIVLNGIVASAGGVLLFGSPSARKQSLWILLVYWLLTAVLAAAQWFVLLLWETWPLLPGASPAWAIGLIAVETILGAVMVVGLFRATPAGSRSRYGANVAVSVAVVVLVVTVLNMLSFASPYQHDFETLGRFGLSERSKRILADVQKPIRLWAVYADAHMNAQTQADRTARNEARKRLRRVLELFKEIRRANPNIEVQDASGDAARARLMNELRTLQKAKTGRQEALLERIRQHLPDLFQEFDTLRKQWSQTPADSYLAQWDLGGATENALAQAQEKITSTDRKIAQTLTTTPLPDYVTLLNDLLASLRQCQQMLHEHTELLKRLEALPETVRANAAGARKSMKECLDVIRRLHRIAEEGGTTGPREPAKMLQTLMTELNQAGQTVRDAAAKLNALAGKDPQDARLLSGCRAWQAEIPTPVGTIRTTRGQLLLLLARDIDALRAQAAIQASDANTDAQRKFIVELREPIETLLTMVQQNQTDVEEGLRRLSKPDAFSRKVLDEARDERIFEALRQRITPWLTAAEELPASGEVRLPPDLSGKNIIVLQAGKKIEVVAFNEAWPERLNMHQPSPDAEAGKRFFNGDAVLASKILNLTQTRPFARVLIAYLQPNTPPQLRQRLLQGEIPPSQLTSLRQRLREANLQVQDWNLAEAMPAETTDPPGPAKSQPATQPKTQPAPKPLPVVLLVVPPAPPLPPMGPNQPPMPGFGPEHLAKLRDAIDDGASALFLACYLPPKRMGFGPARPQPYAMNEYLRSDWGIEAMTEYMLVEGNATEQPGQFQINPLRTHFMPVNNYTEQPIGKPLQGRRTIWTGICPIQPVETDAPAGANVQPLLTIPKTMTNVWGAGNLQSLVREIERNPDGLVRPHYDEGDLKTPLTLAVAATRPAQPAKGVSASRLVLLGLGLGLIDPYLDAPIPILTEQGGYETAPPPKDNLDLAVNAVYWLAGKEAYLAPGPSLIQPVRPMSPLTQNIVWSFCVILLPLAVIVTGAAVLLARRKP